MPLIPNIRFGAMKGLVVLCVLHMTGAELVGTVILSRHGVRTPYGPTGGNLTEESMIPFSNRTFPIGKEFWGVDGTAQLTPHGELVLEHMGEFYGSDKRYASILSSDGCEKISIFSDIDKRDQLTAASFLKGLMPSCVGKVDVSTRNYQTMFNQGNYPSTECELASHEIMVSLTGGDERAAAYQEANMAMVEYVNRFVGCCNVSLCDGKSPCSMTDLPVRWSDTLYEPMTGPVGTAAYFAEYFLLEGLNGLPIAWDELSLSEVVDMYQLEVQDYSLVDNFWAAQSFVSTLASYILASLLQMTTASPVPGIMHGPETRLLYLAAHDTNIVLLRHILQADWITKGWRLNNPPPGGMLVFELHQNATIGHFVRVFFEAASPEQIRGATRFHPFTEDQPYRTSISIPGCVSPHDPKPNPHLALDCPLDKFMDVILNAIRPACVQGRELHDFVETQISDEGGSQPSSENISTLGWAVIGGCIGAVTAGIIIITTTRLRKKRGLLSDSYMASDA